MTAWLEFSFSDAKIIPVEERYHLSEPLRWPSRLERLQVIHIFRCQNHVMGTPHKGHSESDNDSGQKITEHRPETFSRCSRDSPCAHGQINSDPNLRALAQKMRKSKTKSYGKLQLRNFLPTLIKLNDLRLVIATIGQESLNLNNSKDARSKFLNPKQKLNDHKTCVRLPRDSFVSTWRLN